MIEGLFNRPSDLSQMVMPGAVLKSLVPLFFWAACCSVSFSHGHHQPRSLEEEDLLSGVIVGHFFHSTALLPPAGGWVLLPAVGTLRTLYLVQSAIHPIVRPAQ